MTPQQPSRTQPLLSNRSLAVLLLILIISGTFFAETNRRARAALERARRGLPPEEPSSARLALRNVYSIMRPTPSTTSPATLTSTASQTGSKTPTASVTQSPVTASPSQSLHPSTSSLPSPAPNATRSQLPASTAQSLPQAETDVTQSMPLHTPTQSMLPTVASSSHTPIPATPSCSLSPKQSQSSSGGSGGGGNASTIDMRSVLAGDGVFLGRVLARHCGASGAKLLATSPTFSAAFSGPVSVDSALALLSLMSGVCAASHVPFVGRDLWHHHADAAILDRLDSLAVITGALSAGCGANRAADIGGPDAPARACIVFVHSEAAKHAAAAALEYLATSVSASDRLLFVSSSHDDSCVPFGDFDPKVTPDPFDGTHSQFAHVQQLFASPRFVGWYTENPCVLHPKLHPLPLGPKFNWRKAGWDAEDKPPVKQRLIAAMRTVLLAPDVRAAKPHPLLVAVSVETSDNAYYAPFVGVRRQYVDAMNSLRGAMEDKQSARSAPTPSSDIVVGENAKAAYLLQLAASRFAWAPPGNGIDTHRAWECFLVGCVPIVLRSPVSPLYAGLNVLEVLNYSQLTEARAVDIAAWWVPPTAEGVLRPQLFAFYWIKLIEDAAAV